MFNPSASSSSSSFKEKEENVDHILENEIQQNKTETWNKLNKTVKTNRYNNSSAALFLNSFDL